MKESYLWSTMKKGLERADWTRIESSAGTGVFDTNGVYAGKEVWVELKMQKGNRLEFQTSQVNWANRRFRKGAQNLYVLARRDDSLILYSGLVTQLTPMKVYEKTVSIFADPRFVLVTVPKPFDWSAIFFELWRVR